ncbi:MAG: class I SAM-dependent methyltransferase [Candidatus Babeliales bacterium]
MKYHILTAIFVAQSLCGNNLLDRIALKHGTDKSSRIHNYTRHYSHYFLHLRHKPIKFLEIGFCQGASARLWDEYFKKAELYFIDINPGVFDDAKGLSNRCHIDLIDQGNAAQLEEYALKYGPFDIIIDDGGHTMHQQITSFETLFSHVAPGGMYIIEDMHTSYAKGDLAGLYCPNCPKAAVNFLKDRIDDLNFIGAETNCADQGKCSPELESTLNQYQRDITAMHFYTSLVFVFKK